MNAPQIWNNNTIERKNRYGNVKKRYEKMKRNYKN